MAEVKRWTNDGRLVLVDEDTGEIVREVSETENTSGKPFQWKKNLDSGMGMFGMTEDGLGTAVLSWCQKELQKNRESGEQGPFKFGGGWWGNFGERRDDRREERAEKRKPATDITDVENEKDLAEVQEYKGGNWKDNLDENSFLSYAIKNMEEPDYENMQQNENYMIPFLNSARGGIKY